MNAVQYISFQDELEKIAVYRRKSDRFIDVYKEQVMSRPAPSTRSPGWKVSTKALLRHKGKALAGLGLFGAGVVAARAFSKKTRKRRKKK